VGAILKIKCYTGGWKSCTTSLDFEGFSSFRITVDKNGGIAHLAASPHTFNNVTFFAIESTNYANLRMVIDGVRTFNVAGPFMLISRAQLALLHRTISDIQLTNYDTVADADVSIYIGRDAETGPIYGLYFYRDFNSMYAGAL